jgi:hypothetical protein
MKKFLGISALLLAMVLPAFVQGQQNRMSPDDQRKFDNYYSHWIDARQKNDRDEIISQEKRMQSLMARYGIPQEVPYDRIASGGAGYDADRFGNGRHYEGRSRLSPEDQRKFDNYYSHWIEARQKHDGDEIVSQEKRMQNLMDRYGIPRDVPYDRIASQGNDYR